MDFSLTDDQELLRDTAPSCSTASARRRSCARTSTTRRSYEPLWRHLREYTALGAGPATDLCLFLEQTGYAAAPGPFLADALFTSLAAPATTTAATIGTVVAASTIPTQPVRARSRPRRAHRGRRSRARRSRVVDARRRRPRTFVATVDFSRRLFTGRRSRARARRGTARPDACARVARPRATSSLAAEMVGTARRIFDMALAVREGAQAVRRADRVVPGDPAQARRHVARARARDRGRAVRGDDGRRRRRRPHRARATSPRPRPARRRAASSRTASRSTAASATRGSTTCTSTCGARTADEYLLGTDRLAPRPPRRPAVRLSVRRYSQTDPRPARTSGTCPRPGRCRRRPCCRPCRSRRRREPVLGDRVLDRCLLLWLPLNLVPAPVMRKPSPLFELTLFESSVVFVPST